MPKPFNEISVSRGEFKGSPVLTFDTSERFPASMGAAKIALILGNVKECLKFLGESEHPHAADALAEFHGAMNEED
jgi:hypothetical protein